MNADERPGLHAVPDTPGAPGLTGDERAVIAAMEREWPHWQIWTVHKVVGPPSWNARRWDDEKRRHLLHASSATELAEYLEDAVASMPPYVAPSTPATEDQA